jgi:hypothetical protein
LILSNSLLDLAQDPGSEVSSADEDSRVVQGAIWIVIAPRNDTNMLIGNDQRTTAVSPPDSERKVRQATRFQRSSFVLLTRDRFEQCRASDRKCHPILVHMQR